MEATFTPGNWEVDDELQICAHGSVIALTNDRGRAYADEDAANAHLIASAPDLLAALEALESIDDGDSPALWRYAKQFAQARAAISKARGAA